MSFFQLITHGKQDLLIMGNISDDYNYRWENAMRIREILIKNIQGHKTFINCLNTVKKCYVKKKTLPTPLFRFYSNKLFDENVLKIIQEFHYETLPT